MEIYILNIKNDGIRTFRYFRNAYNFVIKWLQEHNLYTDEIFKELRESCDIHNYTGFYIKDLVNCYWTQVEDSKEEY